METLIGFITVDSDSLIDILVEAEERTLKRKQFLKNELFQFAKEAIVCVNEYYKYHRFWFFKLKKKNYIPLTEDMVVNDKVFEDFLRVNHIELKGGLIPRYDASVESIYRYIDRIYEPDLDKADNFLQEIRKIRKSAMDVAKVMISIEKYDEMKYKYGK